ncbi:energy-coupling factor ABC transporter permease [Natranaerobius trueperi]|nr:energy-coupling factor ABC transporter permease [Natranaerobius trueperi]
MTHLHIPDGVLPGIWIFISFALCFVVLGLVINYVKKHKNSKKKIIHTAVISALMLLGMSIPLGLIPYHLNLTVLAGIVLGSGLGFIAAFIVNLFLALVGHGGLTVVGLNTLIIGFEVYLARTIFNSLSNIGLVKRVAFTTVFALLLVTVLMVGVVSTMNMPIEVAAHLECSHHTHETISVSTDHFTNNFISFLLVVLPIVSGGIILESIIISLIVRYITKVKPDLIDYSIRYPVK